MSSRRIRKNDNVIVIAGKDKGRQGTVVNVLNNDRVIVEGINLVKKHVRPDPNAGRQGGIEQQEAAIHISNIMLYNEQSEKGERVGFKTLGEGDKRRKVRFFKSTQEVIDN